MAESPGEQATPPLDGTRLLLLGLAIFDLALGISATFFPHVYLALMHPRFHALHPEGPTYWLTRTGVLWLFFALVEVLAFRAPGKRPALVALVGALRLMDVPADIVYACLADDLGPFGVFGLVFSPAFNLASGIFLVGRGMRGLRSS